jgi:hypothetical protein
VGLTNVWLQTLSDGLVRADQITAIDAHQTPALTGKPSRWLLDVVLPTPTGSGTRGDWVISASHRTLIQTPHDPGDAPAALARLLAQLDAVNATGIITATREEPRTGTSTAGRTGTEADPASTAGSTVRFRFTPFPDPPPGHHTGAEYL